VREATLQKYSTVQFAELKICTVMYCTVMFTCTSNSTISAPWSTASFMEAIVFSRILEQLKSIKVFEKV